MKHFIRYYYEYLNEITMNIDINKSFEHENTFYLTTNSYRIGRALAHYELYKKCLKISGNIVELGVFKGVSFMRFIMFMQLFEGRFPRKIIGFDTFDYFPKTKYEEDKKLLNSFIKQTNGGKSITIEELKNLILAKNFNNYELIKGDILKTVPTYIKDNPALKIALLNIDVDIYEPTKIAIEYLAPRVVKGGIIIFDDYGYFAGETKIADEYCKKFGFKLKRFPFSKRPVYIVKEH